MGPNMVMVEVDAEGFGKLLTVVMTVGLGTHLHESAHPRSSFDIPEGNPNI